MCRFLIAISTAIVFGITAYSQDQSAKFLIPDEGQQEESLKLIKTIFEKDYREATTDEQKMLLARKMLETALDTEDDVSGKYVLLRVARDISSTAGDPQTAESAICEMNRHFQIDLLAMKAAAHETVFKTTVSNEVRVQIANSAMDLAEEFIEDDRFYEGIQVCERAIAESKSLRVPALTDKLSKRKAMISSLAAKYVDVKEAMEKLAIDPLSPGANLAVCKFECFGKNDWSTGLKLIAAGSDAGLKALAQCDLSTDGNDQALKLGDDWWSFAEGLDSFEARNVKLRSVMWYRKSLGSLKGLDRLRVEARISEVESQGDTAQAAQASQTVRETERPLTLRQLLCGKKWERIGRKTSPKIDFIYTFREDGSVTGISEDGKKKSLWSFWSLTSEVLTIKRSGGRPGVSFQFNRKDGRFYGKDKYDSYVLF